MSRYRKSVQVEREEASTVIEKTQINEGLKGGDRKWRGKEKNERRAVKRRG